MWIFLYFALTSLATVEIVSAVLHLRQKGLNLPQSHRLTRMSRLLHPPSLKVRLGLCTVAKTWQLRSISEMAHLFHALKIAGFHNQSPLLTMVQINESGQTNNSDWQSSFFSAKVLLVKEREKEEENMNCVIYTSHIYPSSIFDNTSNEEKLICNFAKTNTNKKSSCLSICQVSEALLWILHVSMVQ